MATILIRYRVRPEHRAEHLRLAAAVQEELARTNPAGLRYLTLRLDDETFLEIAMGPDLPDPLPSMESFRCYRAGLDDRCEELSTVECTVTGSHGFMM